MTRDKNYINMNDFYLCPALERVKTFLSCAYHVKIIIIWFTFLHKFEILGQLMS